MASLRGLSKEQLIERISFYKNNYIDFIKDFGRIRVPGGIIQFKMYEYQEELARSLQNFDFNIILKARQLGISTIVGAYLGTYIIFNPQSDIIIIAINEDVAKELILKIKIFLEGLPKQVRPVILNPRNKESIELANGSRVKALTSTTKSGRSFTASFLVLDECAFIENVDSLWDSAYPTVSNGGRAILLSTPNGEGNLFHDIWTSAENGDNEFRATKLYWWQMPGRDERWKQRTLSNLRYDMKKFRQEYECSFEASSMSVISLAKINAILKRNSQNKVSTVALTTKSGQVHENLDAYAFPIDGHKYFFSADTAEGLGEDRDASAFIGFDLMDDSVMIEYAHKELNEKQFAKVLMDVAQTYNDAFIVIELKSTGKMVANYLIEWGYKNIIWTDTRMSLYLDPYSKQGVPNHFQVDKPNSIIPGFKTNVSNKVVYVGIMKNAVEEDEVVNIYTKRMLEQQKTYITKPGQSQPRYGASGKNNDDLVAAFGIGLFIKKYIWKIIENNNILNQQILDFFSRKVEDMSTSQMLTESSAFSPIYNMKKFKDRINPYKNPLSEMYGDTRYLLDNYKPKKDTETQEK